MSQPTSLLKLTLLTLAVWLLTGVVYFISLVAAAGAFARAPMSAAEIAVLVLIVGQIVLACLSVAYVFYLSGGYFSGVTRLVWVIPFAVLQFALCAVAFLVTLLAFNR
jgi:hypothetical protein